MTAPISARPVVLIICDGMGIGTKDAGNAIELAGMPYLHSLYARYPSSRLSASGEDVGLPAGQMGNSEVGHLNIGAGRIVYQELTRISKDIRDGSFFLKTELVAICRAAARSGRPLHLMGLLSDGGVHSHIDHVKALVELARRHDVRDIVLHCFMDGRDTPPMSGAGYVADIESFARDHGSVRFGIISGRYYAMDRDKRWDRQKLAYDAITGHSVPFTATSASEAVALAYARGETDEFIKPTRVGDGDVAITDGDHVIFFNFRADRARQLTSALTEDGFDGFERHRRPRVGDFVTMTPYDERLAHVSVVYKPEQSTDILGAVVAGSGITQLRIAETEKYAHVTYFFNGGEEKPFEGEDRCLIPSPKQVATYDLLPEMSAVAVTDELLARIASDRYGFIVINYANCDMVGHTGNLPAAVKACTTVDDCLSRVVPAILERGGSAVITADHGNAEQMLDRDGKPHTAHTTNPVPFICVTADGGSFTLHDGILADIAPTILHLLGITRPSGMTGACLISD